MLIALNYIPGVVIGEFFFPYLFFFFLTGHPHLFILIYSPYNVIGNKRTYEYIDLFSSSSIPSQYPGKKIVDVSREHKMVGLELPDIPMRPATILLSNGLKKNN